MRLTSKTVELTTCLALTFAAGAAWAQTEAMPESAPVVLSPVGYPAAP